MDDVLVIGGGPAGLFSAWLAAAARRKGARAGGRHRHDAHHAGLDRRCCEGEGNLEDALRDVCSQSRPQHPYALAGLDALDDGVASVAGVVRAVRPALRRRAASGTCGFRPRSARRCPPRLRRRASSRVTSSRPGPMLIAGPAGGAISTRRFARQPGAAGLRAEPSPSTCPRSRRSSSTTSRPGWRGCLTRPEVRERVGAQIKARLNGATRVGLPAVLGLNDYPRSWQHLQELVGVPVFEIPTLPPSVPGMRLYNVFKNALARAGVQVLLNMPVERRHRRGEPGASAAAVQNVVRETRLPGRKRHPGDRRPVWRRHPRATITADCARRCSVCPVGGGRRRQAEWFRRNVPAERSPDPLCWRCGRPSMRPLDERGQVRL